MYFVHHYFVVLLFQDDLASDGLLLIRLEADERGRYGFNVKVSECAWVKWHFVHSI